MTTVRILVVEDEFLIRLTLCEALGDEGFEVVEASSAEEALAAVAEGAPFRLILTDVQLRGGLSGIELIRAVRRNWPDMPVIFMTGRPDAMAESCAGGRDVTVAKPYQLSDICATVRQLAGW